MNELENWRREQAALTEFDADTVLKLWVFPMARGSGEVFMPFEQVAEQCVMSTERVANAVALLHQREWIYPHGGVWHLTEGALDEVRAWKGRSCVWAWM